MINIPKGTKDVLPEESYRWQYLEGLARETAALFGAREIRTPTFEATELFARGVGDTTDVVTKEMYTFMDKGGRSMTLKPEGTAGVCRSFIENGLSSKPMPMKSYYFTPVFRYERPQAGRLREHHQFGVEYYGASSAVTDAEVILLAKTFLEKAGVTSLALKINSIGCKTCRARFNAALKEFLAARLDQMCATCKERFDRNPLRIIDCKEQGCKELLVGAPVITDYLCEDCEAHFTQLKNTLTAAGVEYAVDPTIVRGLDYYTRTVFEFVCTQGAMGTVCGGGRYDGLVESLGGKSTPCVGFGLGLERLLGVLDAQGVTLPAPAPVKVYFAPMGEEAKAEAFRMVTLLRKAGVSAETDLMDRSFKAQFKYADKLGAEYVIALGESELNSGEVTLKHMATGETTPMPLFEVVNRFIGEVNEK